MAEFERPYDPQQLSQSGCICGRHRNQLEHEHEAHRMLQCVPVVSESKRYDGVLAREAMRVNFPKG
jgi:nitrate/nitrite transport system substrate-binding protein